MQLSTMQYLKQAPKFVGFCKMSVWSLKKKINRWNDLDSELCSKKKAPKHFKPFWLPSVYLTFSYPKVDFSGHNRKAFWTMLHPKPYYTNLNHLQPIQGFKQGKIPHLPIWSHGVLFFSLSCIRDCCAIHYHRKKPKGLHCCQKTRCNARFGSPQGIEFWEFLESIGNAFG